MKRAVFEDIRFWLDRGVDGFRLDVVNGYVKDELFRSNPFALGRVPRLYDMQRHLYDCDRPELHDILRDLRALMDSYGERTTVGEVMVRAPGDARRAASYLGDGTDELHMVFDFTLLHLPWNARRFLRQIESWYRCIPEKGWPTIVFSNHDVPRSFSRYGKGMRKEKARLIALLLLTLRGTPFIYYGEEIGMADGRIRRAELQDPVGLHVLAVEQGARPCAHTHAVDRRAECGLHRRNTLAPDRRSRRCECRAAGGRPVVPPGLLHDAARSPQGTPLPHRRWLESAEPR